MLSEYSTETPNIKGTIKRATSSKANIQKGKSPQREQNSILPSQNLLQTNQSDRDQGILLLQTQIESSKS